MSFFGKRRHALPGFGLSLGFTIAYLSLIVLVPLSMILLKTSSLTFETFWATISTPRAIQAYKLSVFASLGAALVNLFFGVLVAWVLVRYDFFGKGIVDAFVDLPFALPTAVGGIALTGIYASKGWIGPTLERLGIKATFTPLGVGIALTFVGLPFVVRTVQPVLEELELEQEECAAILGAGRFTTLRRIVLPSLVPPAITGFAMAFARALGEYGSVVFISGNMPGKTEIIPLLIMTKLEQFDYAGATAIALVMLVGSFTMLLAVNRLQAWSGKNTRGTRA